MMQCASHLNLGHAIQVINQNDPVPARILSIAPPTTTPRQLETTTDELTQPQTQTVTDELNQPQTQTMTDELNQPQTQIMTDEATPLRVSGVATWISVLVLYLFAAANY